MKKLTADEPAADLRKARLADQLRANLQKRKAQARARRAGDEDQRNGIGEKKPAAQED